MFEKHTEANNFSVEWTFWHNVENKNNFKPDLPIDFEFSGENS